MLGNHQAISTLLQKKKKMKIPIRTKDQKSCSGCNYQSQRSYRLGLPSRRKANSPSHSMSLHHEILTISIRCRRKPHRPYERLPSWPIGQPTLEEHFFSPKGGQYCFEAGHWRVQYQTISGLYGGNIDLSNIPAFPIINPFTRYE